MHPADASSDEAVSHARAEAQRLRAELEDWRKLAEAGEATAVSFARAERGLLAQIEQHEATAREVGIPADTRTAAKLLVQRWRWTLPRPNQGVHDHIEIIAFGAKTFTILILCQIID